MKKNWLLGCAALLTAAGAAAQGQVAVTARVLPAWQMEVASATGDANYTVTQHVVTREKIVLVIERRSERAAQAGPIQIVLALRTNAASFSVYASADGAGRGVEVTIGDPSAGGTGQQLSDEALASFRGIAQGVSLRSDEETIARGGRISARGNFRSAHNALLVPLRIMIPAHENAREPVRISLRIGE